MKITRKQIVFPLAIIALLVLFGYTTRPSTFDPHRVGDVVYSILAPEDFKKEHGESWILMDGTPVTGTRLQKDYNITRSPNALGRFVRTMNHKEKGDDPDGNRRVGDFQSDTLTKHHHGYRVGSRTAGHNYQSVGGEFWNESGDEERLKKARRMQTTEFGGDETRPKNICLYAYIKVND